MQRRTWVVAYLLFVFAGLCGKAQAQSVPTPKTAERIIIGSGVGKAIDDAFAIAPALRRLELDILWSSNDYGDTEGRARLLHRMLGVTGRQKTPVVVGAAPEDPPISQPCPVPPMYFRVDDRGITHVEGTTPHGQRCLHSDANAGVRFYMQRLLAAY
jgi:hypothetical protein